MSSDHIKEALIETFGGTTEKEWKRRTKFKTDSYIKREFEHTIHGIITTYETHDGKVSVGTEPEAAPLGSMSIPITVHSKAAQPVKVSQPVMPPKDVLNNPPITPLPTGDIPVGSCVEVPAGTMVYDISYKGTTNGALSSRSRKVNLKEIVTIANWLTIAPEKNREKIEEILDRISDQPYSGKIIHILSWIDRELTGWSEPRYYVNKELMDAIAEAKIVTEAFYNNDLRFVIWGVSRGTHISNVNLVAAVAPPKVAKEAKITNRRLMVKGSQWRVNKTTDIMLWIENPKIWEMVAKRDSLSRSNNSQHRQGNSIVVVLGGGKGNTPSELQMIDTIQKEIHRLMKEEPAIQVNAATIEEGTVLVVTDKIAPDYYSFQNKNKTNGLMVPVKVASGKVQVDANYGKYLRSSIPYKQLDGVVEPLMIPEEIAYVLRDSKTGEFFGGWETARSSAGYEQQTNVPKMSATFSGAKKYKTSSAVKASIRDFTGYNDGLERVGGHEEWLNGGEKKIDLPPTWEMVAIDKTTNNEKEIIDVQNWYSELMRLRILTAKHGSAVRGVYKAAQGKGMEAIVVVSNMEDNTYGGTTSRYPVAWEDDEHMSKKMALIKDAVENTMVDKTYRFKSEHAVAYACSRADAMLFRLSMSNPDFDVQVYDFNTLEEIVEDQ